MRLTIGQSEMQAFRFPYLAPDGRGAAATVGFVLEDAALQILIARQQLTLHQLRLLLRQELRTSVEESWLAATVQQMCRKGLVEQREGYFAPTASLANELSQTLCSLSSFLPESLDGNPGIRSLQRTGFGSTLEFSSLKVGDDVLAKFHAEFLGHLDPTHPILWHLGSAWWPLAHPWSMVKRTRVAAGPPASYAIPGDSPVDRWVRCVYAENGIVGHLGVRSPYELDFWLGKNLLVWIEMAPALTSEIRSFIGSARDIESFDEGQFIRSLLGASETFRLNVAVLPKTVELLRADFADYLLPPALAA